MNGMHLSKVEELSIHGGSNRYWLNSSTEDNFTDSSVHTVINFEVESRLFDAKQWASYSSKVESILSEFLGWLRAGEKSNRKIFGYGAAAKASTILN